MAKQSWLRRVVTAIDHEYERRIRAASLVSEYGVGHHDAHEEVHDLGEEVAEIVNVPRDAQLGRRRRSAAAAEATDSEGDE